MAPQRRPTGPPADGSRESHKSRKPRNASKPRAVEAKLEALEAAVASASDAELPGVIVAALADRHCRVAGYAAKLAERRLVYAAIPALIDAWARFLVTPVKRDPGCLAKKAIVRALVTLDCDDAGFWIAALDYRQMEPVWGGSADTAADVRSSAAMGLVASGYPRALVEVARLLTDPEPAVRQGAARAIACGNPREAELLLRLKVMTGDADALVIGECFTGLLTVEPDETVDFVARGLADDSDEIREVAALALGESRLPAAFEAVRAAYDGIAVPAWFRRVLLRAAALHRTDAAIDWILGIVARAPAAVVPDALEALSIYRGNDRLTARIEAALTARGADDPYNQANKPGSKRSKPR